jgi:hypothetical protein
VPYPVVDRNPLDQRRDPIVGQRGGNLDASLRQLLVNLRAHIHVISP